MTLNIFLKKKKNDKQIKGGNQMQDTINQFLEFRKQFTASQWHEINNIIDSQYRKKAAELQLSKILLLNKKL